jgi:hypothetical protein
MSKWKANLVTIASPSSDGTNYTGKANGVWKSTDQIQQKNASLWAKGILPPSAPTIGTASTAANQVTVTFTAPATINGDSITGYTLWTTTGLSVSGSTGITSLTLTGLTNGTSYSFYVVADSTSGSSIPSSTISATPGAFTAPSVPSLSISSLSGTSVRITVIPPSSNGGGTIQEYRVTRTQGNIVTSLFPSSLTFDVTGLTPFSTYTFTVSCYNTYGTSPTSSPYAITLIPSVGDSALGGYYAGKVNNGTNTYALIVAPKATGEATNKAWQTTTSSVSGAASEVNGYENSVAIVTASGTAGQAASFCRGLAIGGYNDWYLPSYAEILILYYSFKPTTTANNLSTNGDYPNPYAVAPQPVNVGRTVGDPAQTTRSNFQAGNSEQFTSTLTNGSDDYWTSTQGPGPTWSTDNAWFSWFGDGKTYFWNNGKQAGKRARAIRRVAI